MKKKIIFLLLLAFSFVSVFAQDEESDFDNFDELFSDAEDIVVEEQKEAPKLETSQKGITLSGYLDSDVGGGLKNYTYIDDDGQLQNNFSVYGGLALENYVYMTARASDALSLRATLYTVAPAFSLSLREMYFSYLLLDKIYIQAGKHDITWGNLQLIENNILSDAYNTASVYISFSAWKFDFAGLVMYSNSWGGSYTPNMNNVSFAGRMGAAFGSFQFNIFARRWANYDSSAVLPALGLETKVSIKGYDIYNQSVINAHYDLKDLSQDYFDKITCTTGFMKDWDDPRVGFIVEYRYIYYNKLVNPDAVDGHRLHLKAAISRLFNNTSKFAIETWHDFSDFSNIYGHTELGYIYYALPQTDLKAGIYFDYTSTSWTIIPAVALSFEWTY